MFLKNNMNLLSRRYCTGTGQISKHIYKGTCEEFIIKSNIPDTFVDPVSLKNHPTFVRSTSDEWLKWHPLAQVSHTHQTHTKRRLTGKGLFMSHQLFLVAKNQP